MAIVNKTNRSKSTVVNESVAKPTTPEGIAKSIQVLSNAMQGTYGSGPWDGGLGESASGNYHRYAMFWDAKLLFTATGSVPITFPFTVVESIVKVYDVATRDLQVYYIENSNQLTIPNAGGKTIVEVSLVQNTKEA